MGTTLLAHDGCSNAACVSFRSGLADGIIIRTSRERLPQRAREIDQPLAALITDLKQRGLLDSTLIIWGGEFGRKPTATATAATSPDATTTARRSPPCWPGAASRAALAYGATDEFGAAAVQNKVHVHDLHATVLQLLGFDHEKLTYRYNGRDFRLTDVYGNVVSDLIA